MDRVARGEDEPSIHRMTLGVVSVASVQTLSVFMIRTEASAFVLPTCSQKRPWFAVTLVIETASRCGLRGGPMRGLCLSARPS